MNGERPRLYAAVVRGSDGVGTLYREAVENSILKDVRVIPVSDNPEFVKLRLRLFGQYRAQDVSVVDVTELVEQEVFRRDAIREVLPRYDIFLLERFGELRLRPSEEPMFENIRLPESYPIVLGSLDGDTIGNSSLVELVNNVLNNTPIPQLPEAPFNVSFVPTERVPKYVSGKLVFNDTDFDNFESKV